MNDLENEITFLAKTNYRNQNILFGIKQKDRLLHTYIIGKTGTRKTSLLRNQILQDIQHNRGCCVFDVHGDLIENIYTNIPKKRIQDIVYLNIPDSEQSFKFNPFLKVPYEKRSLVAVGNFG